MRCWWRPRIAFRTSRNWSRSSRNPAAAESALHREVFRPWGSYDSIDSGERFQVKRLSVKPGGVLSLQMHHHRAEHWVVVSGTARITCDDKVFLLSENQSTYIPVGSTHRIENPGKVFCTSSRCSPDPISARMTSCASKTITGARDQHVTAIGELEPAIGFKAIAGFKAYDLRGRIPDELNEDVAYRVGRGYAQFLSPRRVVVGRDIRLSSAALTDALCRGLTDSGVDVIDIGICGTEGVYFATFDGGYDGGIMVTASHNPSDYNGMKFVREQSKPISGDNGLQQIRGFAERAEFPAPARLADAHGIDTSKAYVAHLLSYVDLPKLRPLKIVVNAGNGGAGLVIDELEPHLPFQFVKVHHEPDGRFPNGIPNPMLEENRASTSAAIRAEKADFGVAWDGDFDRCFLFDERGASSRATTSSDCWPRCCCAGSGRQQSCTIRA
jgi:mannose-6-phosphate isomerase-like protein (cupin superfamily)